MREYGGGLNATFFTRYDDQLDPTAIGTVIFRNILYCLVKKNTQ